MRLVLNRGRVPGQGDSSFQRLVFRIAAQEALDNKGLEVLANLIENHTDVKILEHTLHAHAEKTYSFPGKVGNLYIKPKQIQPLILGLQQMITQPCRQNSMP